MSAEANEEAAVMASKRLRSFKFAGDRFLPEIPHVVALALFRAFFLVVFSSEVVVKLMSGSELESAGGGFLTLKCIKKRC